MSKSLRLLRFVAVAAAVAFLALAVAQQDLPPAQAVFTDSDGDGVIDLAEEITGSDPSDASSTPESTGASFLSAFPLCSDGVDNDRDGLTDGDDDGCTDSDGDVVSDPAEMLLGSDPLNAGSFPEDSRLDTVLEFNGLPIFFCADSVDNDGDGLTDGDDPGCTPIGSDGDDFDDATEKRYGSDPSDAASVPEHEIPNPGSCSDGVDNDLDGLTDGDDPACQIAANDNRADATVITALPFTDGPLVMKNATTEPGEPRPSCSYGSVVSTVWYSYTPADDAVLIADTVGSDFDTVLAVWTESGSRLTEVGCNSYFGSSSQSRIAFQASAGQTYLFQVDGFPFDNPMPSLTFNLEAGIPPANDDFLDVTTITALPFTDTVDTEAATTEHGEPTPSCIGTAASTVWYSFTPAEDTLLVAYTTGSDFDTVIAVWAGSAFGPVSKPIACDYGYSFDISPYARLAFQASADQTYFFQVGGFSYGTSFGSLTFSLEVGVPPANDNFADATSITALPFTDSTDTLNATTEPGEPTPSCVYENADSTLWYSFTPDADTLLLADTTGSDFYGTFIAVYQGTSLSDLTQVACGTPSFPEVRLAFQATGGKTYYFQVGGLSFTGIVFGREPPQEASRWSDSRSFQAGGSPATSGSESSGNLVFNLDAFAVPPCPAPQFSVEDPVGDTIDFGVPPDFEVPEHDITSVSGGSDAQTFCLTVEFAGPVDPPDAGTEQAVVGIIDFDTDGNPGTGFESSIDYYCEQPSGLGVETEVSLFDASGILVPIYQFFEPPLTEPLGFESQAFAAALFDETSFTLVVPLAALGGDDSFNFALALGSSYSPTDCVPNRGFIRSPTASILGDVGCDENVNAIDAALILQYDAGLGDPLLCLDAADVNGDGDVNSIDAVLILQFDARLLESLPP